MIRIRNKLWRSDGYISWFIIADLSGLFCCRPSHFTGCSLLPAKLRALLASKRTVSPRSNAAQYFLRRSSFSVAMKGKENLRMEMANTKSQFDFEYIPSSDSTLVRMWTVQSEFHIQFLPLVFMCLMVMLWLSWRKSGKMLFFRVLCPL